ncbi:MAG: hypothetical protein KCHDKBKB_01003 [Elusimicrobia bacterium]|nr:hypothetical protein [Elusimicrobiota bacterium]
MEPPLRKMTRLFSFLCFTLALLGLSFVFMSVSASSTAMWSWFLAFCLSLVFIPANIIHQVIFGFERSPDLKKIPWGIKQQTLTRSGYAASAILFAMTVGGALSSQMSKAEVLSGGAFSRQLTGLAVFYGLCCLIVGVAVVKGILGASDLEKKSRVIYLAGATTILVSLLFTILPGPSRIQPRVFLIPSLVITGSLIFMAVSLTTKRIYQAVAYFKHAMSSVAFAVLISLIFLVIELLVTPMTIGDKSFIGKYIGLSVGALIIVFLVIPARYEYHSFMERLLAGRGAGQKYQLKDLSKALPNCSSREQLMATLFEGLKNGETGFESVRIFLKDSSNATYHLLKTTDHAKQSQELILTVGSAIVRRMMDCKCELYLDMLREQSLSEGEYQTLVQEMKMLGSEACFPLFPPQSRDLAGFVMVGDSRMGSSSYGGKYIFWLRDAIKYTSSMLEGFNSSEIASEIKSYLSEAAANHLRDAKSFKGTGRDPRIWAAVLMVDIRDFTPLAARLDSRQVIMLLQDYRTSLAAVVRRNGGTIDKFIGDGIMVVFGLPGISYVPDPDRRAVICALEMMKEIQRMNARRKADGLMDQISIGIGIASGQVIAGNVQSGDRVEYTVIGDAVNLVSRLEDEADPSQIIIAASTFESIKEEVEFKDLGAKKFKGIERPVNVYEIRDMKWDSGQMAVNE